KTAKSLAAYERKTDQLKAKLASLHTQAAELQSEVEELDVSIAKTSSSIDTLKNAYAESVRKRYVDRVYRKERDDTTIFSDRKQSAEQARRAYLSHIVSAAFHRNKNELDSTKSTLSENKE